MKRWLVFNVGCIECGVESNVVGTYDTLDQAVSISIRLNKVLSWRDGGQNLFEVFDLQADQDPEYVEALAAATGEKE